MKPLRNVGLSSQIGAAQASNHINVPDKKRGAEIA
jgi:hypothetical protein